MAKYKSALDLESNRRSSSHYDAIARIARAKGHQEVRVEGAENTSGQIYGGLVVLAVFGLLTWLQIGEITEHSYWIIFRVWLIPIPIILLTGFGGFVGIIMLFSGIFKRLTQVGRK